jgi:hypothetical protein
MEDITQTDYSKINAKYLKDLTPYEQELFTERAAIMEFDAKLDPEIAAKKAYENIIKIREINQMEK